MAIQRALSKRLVALGVLLVAASLAALGDRVHWTLELLAHFKVHYAALGVALALGLACLRRPAWASAMGAVGLWHLLAPLSYWIPSAPPAPSTDLSDPIRILQYNVNRSNPTPDAVAEWIAGRAEDLDVIALFEVSSSWTPLLDRLAARFPQSTVSVQEDNFGIAVFSRMPAEVLEAREISSSRVPSVVLEALTPVARHPFVLYATHPPPPMGGLLAGLRNEQLVVLGEKLARRAGRSRILLGDLNVTPWSSWFTDLEASAGLRDAQRGLGYAATWTPRALPVALGLALDHILVSEDVVVLDRTHGPRMGSDHRPILTTLAFRRRR